MISGDRPMPPPPPPSVHLPSSPPSSAHHMAYPLSLCLPIASSQPSRLPHIPAPAKDLAGEQIGRVRLADIAPYDGAPCDEYARAVEALSGSLMRHNAVVVELGGEDAVVLRCALESVRMYFKARALGGSAVGGAAGMVKGKGVYKFRAGRALEDGELSPACMNDAFSCMGKSARAALCAIARHLRLRSNVFNHLLDDTPLPANEVSSSILVASCSQQTVTSGREPGLGKTTAIEVEKGFLSLFASDTPGIQVCDPNGHWYLADEGLGPGDLILVTGRALSHATAGLRPAASFRYTAESSLTMRNSGRASLTFRLMPQSNGILDCSPISAAGHVVPQSFKPISVSQFLDDLSSEEDMAYNIPNNACETENNLVKDQSLRSVLSDPISGLFLEDAVVVSCGHSYGGHMLKKVLETRRCNICDVDIESGVMIPNIALRAAATTVKMQDDKRLFYNAAQRKRRKEVGDQMDALRRMSKENGEMAADADCGRPFKGVQYPFAVDEKVLIIGNKRTPDKFVGREALITSQCLNGWYLLKILDSGENVRLQYRSLQKLPPPPPLLGQKS